MIKEDLNKWLCSPMRKFTVVKVTIFSKLIYQLCVIAIKIISYCSLLFGGTN